MPEVKDVFLKIRLTKSEKEFISKYAEEHNMTISDLIRIALNKYINQEEDKHGK